MDGSLATSSRSPALCAVPPRNHAPTPCGGGEDRDGAAGASGWVSSNPPRNAAGRVRGAITPWLTLGQPCVCADADDAAYATFQLAGGSLNTSVLYMSTFEPHW
jgi:hypothetical protein